LAQHQRSNFDVLVPFLKYHSIKKDTWSLASPVLTSRAEKILFWENFSNLVSELDIDKSYLTVDAWTYDDLDKGLETIQKGEEISSLPDLKETLIAYYLDKSGKIIIAESAYSFNAKSKICLLYTSPSPRDRTRSRMPSSA